MCVQCAAGATTAAAAVGGAAGLRAWLAAKGFAWMTPRRLTAATVVLATVGVVGGSALGGA